MFLFQALTTAACLMMFVSAGRIENRQGPLSALPACAKTSNISVCPETYCLCSSLELGEVFRGTVPFLAEVNQTAAYATTEAGGCPLTAPGSLVTTSLKTGSACDPTPGPPVTTSPIVSPSSTTNQTSSTQPVNWMITSTSTCLSNGHYASSLTPSETCGPSLTAQNNCVFSVPILGPSQDGAFNGCNCVNSWATPVPTSPTVRIVQPWSVWPSYQACGGPTCQVIHSTARGTPGLYCDCDAFISEYSLSTLYQNPSWNVPYATTVTGTCASSVARGRTHCACTQTGTSLYQTQSTSSQGPCSSTESWVVNTFFGGNI